MSNAEIDIQRFDLPKQVFGGGSGGGNKEIRSDQFIAEFTVKVDEDGCYAIDVKLVEDDSELITFGLNQDEIIASHTSATYPCFCFQKGKPKEFRITAKGAPNEQPLTPDNPKATSLPPLEGYWPKSDAGSELEIRLEISVYSCHQKCKQEDKKCKPISARNLGNSIGKKSEKEQDVGLLDGAEPHEILKPIAERAVGAGVGAINPSIIKLNIEVAKLKRELKKIR